MNDIIDIVGILITIISVLFIAYKIYSYRNDIYKYKEEGKLEEQRRYIEQRPTFTSTLGVLGTFLGITFGLAFFDTSDINGSIPHLLDGLKTAFLTSLTGMVGSMFLSKMIDEIYDEYEKEKKRQLTKPI